MRNNQHPLHLIVTHVENDYRSGSKKTQLAGERMRRYHMNPVCIKKRHPSFKSHQLSKDADLSFSSEQTKCINEFILDI